MARREERTIGDIARQIRDEARHQLRGFPREAKRQLRGFGGEATYQLGHGWGKEIARQILGPPKGRHGR